MLKLNEFSFFQKPWSALPYSVKAPLWISHRKSYWSSAGIIFVHVPKAAGTSVSHTLYGRS